MNNEDCSAAIEAAFRKLDIQPDSEWQIRLMVDTMTLLQRPSADMSSPSFRVKDRKAAQKEVDDLAANATKLAHLLDDLSSPSIDALADSGLLQIAHPVNLSRTLKLVATVAARADLSSAEKTGDRKPMNNHAKGVAAILAEDYFRLTGKKPSLITPSDSDDGHKKYSPFITLIGDVFKALGINARPEHYAMEARENFHRKSVE